MIREEAIGPGVILREPKRPKELAEFMVRNSELGMNLGALDSALRNPHSPIRGEILRLVLLASE